jgi:O-antigen/teichoic acid export membrane protein
VGLQQSVQRKGDFKTTATAEFFGRCTYVVATLLGALALPNIVGLMSSTLANATGKLSWLLRVGGVLPRSLWQFSGPPIAKSIRRLALSTSASNLISLVSGFAPMIFIADRYGASALGQYGLVVSTLYLPSTLIGQAIGQVYYQRACRMHGEGLAFHSLLIQTSIYLVRVAIPMYTFIAFIAPWAYPFIFGAAWEASGAMARWLCIAAAAGFISTPVDRSSIVVGAWWYLSIWHILCALMTGFALLASAILNLPVESCIILLALQKAVTYLIDWIASYSLSNGKYKTYLAFEPEREL